MRAQDDRVLPAGGSITTTAPSDQNVLATRMLFVHRLDLELLPGIGNGLFELVQQEIDLLGLVATPAICEVLGANAQQAAKDVDLPVQIGTSGIGDAALVCLSLGHD